MKHRYNFFIVITFFIVISLLMPVFVVRAQQEDENKGKNSERQEEVAEKKENKENEKKSEEGNKETNRNEEEILKDIVQEIQRRTALDQAISAQVQSTSTPAQHGDPYNQGIENVLNENLPPETPIKKEVPEPTPKPTPKKETPSRSSTTKATTTPIGGTTDPKKPDSLTPADSGEHTVNGASNSFSPNNYYIPLDNLSPEVTYGLSFIALLSGIAGAVLIIRDPRTRTAPEEGWAPAPARFTQKPLLEP
ncbi:hypothetical protein KW782_03595 [Candidatus Parcubacteria bacterium]|nr:hypothetical protein [Candidatus Parcubacteria bacterium]